MIFKRHIFYIEKKFQAWFIVKFCTLVAFGSLLTIVLVYWLAQRSTTVAINEGHVAVRTTADFLLPVMIQTTLIQLLVVTIATIIMVLFVSHKIAGPIYRLKIMLQGLGEGNIAAPMHLRKGDQLLNLAEVYSKATLQLNEKLKKLKQSVDSGNLQDCKRILDGFKTT